MNEGVLTTFLDRAEENMDEANRNIMKPGRRAASRTLAGRRQQDSYARSLAGTALTRWAQMGLEEAGLKAEARLLEKAPTSMEAATMTQQLNDTAEQRVAGAKEGRQQAAREILAAAAQTGALLQTALESQDDQEAQAARQRLAQQSAALLELCYHTVREEHPMTRLSWGEEARHAVESARDGTAPEGIPGSRGWLRNPNHRHQTSSAST